jgi:hypothetical protein
MNGEDNMPDTEPKALHELSQPEFDAIIEQQACYLTHQKAAEKPILAAYKLSNLIVAQGTNGD